MPAHNRLPDAVAKSRYYKILGQMPKGQPTIEIFAELICGGADERLALPPMQAAELMGYSADYGNAMLQRIRRGLGEWAK